MAIAKVVILTRVLIARHPMTDILAKDLLLAAGWVGGDDWATHTDGRYIEHDVVPDDNLCDMLIRELSEEQIEVYEDNLCSTVECTTKLATYGASLLRATAQQKAQALMETYKEKP